jgi:phosphoglycerate dehydrogenase-like enzyme
MSVLVFTKDKLLHQPKGLSYVSLDQLLERADIVSLHLNPDREDNHGIVDEYFLEQVKYNGALINCAGSQLVVEDDLLYKLKHNRAFCYCTDSFED